MLRMESILPDLPPLPRRRITLPLSTLAEVARDVCDGYDPPAKGRAYAKAHPLWRELPSHLHALMNAIVSVCRGRAGELTLTRCTSLGKMIGRSARTVRRQLVLIAEHGRRFPNGRLAEEAGALRVRSLAGLGRASEARAALATFAAHFPHSVVLPGLRQLLDRP